MVETHGALAMHLDGSPMTCHEQHPDDDYRTFCGRRNQYGRGDLPAEAVVTVSCDALEITP